MDKEDKIALVLVLLKQLQPYLSASNLSMPAEAPNGSNTLNKVLDNINVKTHKTDKLPRKNFYSSDQAGKVNYITFLSSPLRIQTGASTAPTVCSVPNRPL